MPTRETGVAEMDDQLTAALAERAWTEPEWGNDGTDWVSSCGSYWARGEAGFSSVRWYLREDMSIEARTTTLSEALTQLDLLTPAAPEQLPRDGSTKDRYTAPAPGEMQYRANKLLGELIEKMRRPPRLKMRPALVGHDLSELIEWLDYTMGTNVSDPVPARELQESTLQPLDEESDPVRIYDVACTALQLRYGDGLSWARAVFGALEVGGGSPELCDPIEPTGRNAADVYQVVQYLEHGGRGPAAPA